MFSLQILGLLGSSGPSVVMREREQRRFYWRKSDCSKVPRVERGGHNVDCEVMQPKSKYYSIHVVLIENCLITMKLSQFLPMTSDCCFPLGPIST